MERPKPGRRRSRLCERCTTPYGTERRGRYGACVSTDGLKVDTAVLHTAGVSLRFVHRELTDAAKTADPGSEVIAHEGLRDRLQDFAEGWDRRREEMATSIETLGVSAEQAASAYLRIETELVAALAGER